MKKKTNTLIDLTPKSQLFSCWPLPGCPAIFELNGEDYVIVGKLMKAKTLDIEERVSKGEVAVKIPKYIIDNMHDKEKN